MSLPTTAPNAQAGMTAPASRDLSRTATLESSSEGSPSRTLTDLHAPIKEHVPVESTVLGNVDEKVAKESKVAAQAAADALSSLPPLKKNLAFLTFCLAMFM